MSMPQTPCRSEIEALIAAVRRVGAEVAAAHADEVDKSARFPHEAFAALRRERALAACVPRALGGLGASTSEMALMTQALGEHCAATGLCFAMHLIQVGAIARHGLSSAYLRRYLTEVAERQPRSHRSPPRSAPAATCVPACVPSSPIRPASG